MYCSNNNWQLYRQYRNKVNASIKKSKATYNKNLLEENAKNAKQFWNLVKKLYPFKENASPFLSALEVDGKLETTRQGIASTFCKYFTTCAEKLCGSLQQNFTWKNDNGLGHANSYIKFQSVSKERVTRVVEKLNPPKAPGQDNFPPRFLKDGAAVIGEHLAHIINLSLGTSVVPRKMKIVKVIPLFKSGSKTSVENYCPISVLPALSKVFERIVYDQLSTYLERNILITTSQFGFR